ncbi:hypothetical protein E0X81_12050 [Halomonas sp. GDM18]|nr:hypothetical protein E0X81_12050 [Halomonas sp. GDM18]
MPSIFIALFSAKIFLIAFGGVQLIVNALILFCLILISFATKKTKYLTGMFSNTEFCFILILFSISCIASIMSGYDLKRLLEYSLKYYSIIIFYSAAMYLVSKVHFRKLISYIVAAGFLHCLIAIILYVVGFGEVIHGYVRPSGIARTNNILAGIAAATFIISTNEIVNGSMLNGLTKKLYIFTSAVAIICVAISGSLTKLLTLAIFAILLFLSIRLISHKAIIFKTIYLVGGILVAMLLASFGLLDRLTNIVDDLFLNGFNIDPTQNSFYWRLVHWQLLMEDFHSNLYNLFGMSPGGYVRLNGFVLEKTGETFNTHNDFLLLYLEFGIIIFFYLLIKVVTYLLSSTNFVGGKRIVFLSLSLISLFSPTILSLSFVVFIIPYFSIKENLDKLKCRVPSD